MLLYIGFHLIVYCILHNIGNKVDRPKSTRSSEVGPANRTKRIERGIKSRPKLKRGQTSDDEWFSTESTLSESETKTVSTPSHQEESDSTCKIYTIGQTVFQRSVLIFFALAFSREIYVGFVL